MDIVAATVGIVFAAIDNNVVLPSIEPVIRMVNSSPGRNPDSFALDLDQRVFSRNGEMLHVTASSRLKSIADLNKVNETRNTSFEQGDLLVKEKKFDRQAHTHHNKTLCKNLAITESFLG